MIKKLDILVELALLAKTYDNPIKCVVVDAANEITRLRDVLRRLRQWDTLDTSESDGKFWKREIDAVLKLN